MRATISLPTGLGGSYTRGRNTEHRRTRPRRSVPAHSRRNKSYGRTLTAANQVSTLTRFRWYWRVPTPRHWNVS